MSAHEFSKWYLDGGGWIIVTCIFGIAALNSSYFGIKRLFAISLMATVLIGGTVIYGKHL